MRIMFQHFQKKDRDETTERIIRITTNLDRLVNGALQTPTVKADKLQKDATRNYQRVRKHAMTLYGALKDRLQISSCRCKVCTIHLFYHKNISSFPPLTTKFLWMRRCPIVLFYN